MCNGLRGANPEVSEKLHGQASATPDGAGDPAGGGIQESAGGELLFG